MKILKYSFVILAVSMVANIAVSSATATLEPYQWGISGKHYVPAFGRGSVKTIDVVKTREGNQNFYNDYAETGLTSPCKKCKIMAELQHKVNNLWDPLVSTTVKMDQRGYFSGNNSESPGTYRLAISRADATLLETTVIWDWYVQDPIR